jgi:Protein of unknown function (DUF2950)
MTANATDDMEKELMRTNNMTLETFETFVVRLAWVFVSTVFLLLLGLLLVAGFANSSLAEDAQPKTFASPGEATNALFEAAQKQDEQELEAILGAGKEVTSSSDEVEDKLERERFSQKYQEMHRLVQEPDGSTVLYIGAENWPFPIPLVSRNGAWYFDSKIGIQEIKFRRVGENEATAVEVCTAFATAKKQGDAKAKTDDDAVSQYAESLLSAGGTGADSNNSSPFHGYYFRIVSRKSASEPNTTDVSSGKQSNSLLLVAYPADYRSSGVKTFVVTRDGVVYEKDLGPDTTTVAPQLKARTGSSWRPPV